MISSHPQVFLDITQQQGFDKTKTLSLLVVIKKLAGRYGNLLSKSTMIETIYQSDKDVGTMLAILHELNYKSLNDIVSLIKKLEYLGETVYTIETPTLEIRENIESTLLSSNQVPTVFVEKKLQTPGLHIATPDHRYHRDLNHDLDTLLRDL